MDTIPHVVREGETLEDVSRLFYGDEAHADLIAEVNELPLMAALRAGEVLRVPVEALSFQSIIEQTSTETVVALRVRPSTYVNVPIVELLFPGTGSNTVPLAGKWVYAITEEKIAFVVDARAPDDWFVQRREVPGPDHVTTSRLPLHRDKSYRLMLSPIKLSPACEQRLIDKVDQCTWLTAVDQPARVSVAEPIMLRDPFQWAVDLHDADFSPKLKHWQQWLSNDNRAAQRFMALSFKSILDQGDEPGISDQLRSGQPRAWLAADAQTERERREAAEVAAHYLASWIDSEDHRIIEAAHVDAGTDALGCAVVHWACVVDGLSQVFEGRQLLSVVVSDRERVPRRFVLTDAPQNTLAFGEIRYLSLAARALVAEMGPAIVQVFYPNNPPAARQLVEQWFEQFGEKGISKSVYRIVNRNLKQGRRLSAFVPAKQRKQVQKLVQTVKHAWQENYQASIPRTLVASERLAEAYERNLNKLDKVALSALETMNLAIALHDLARSAPGNDRTAKLISALGASADAGIVLLESVTILKQVTKRTAVGVLGIVSGLCDWYTFTQAAARAADNYDYNQAFGHGVAAAGAGFVVAGSTAVLAVLLGANTWLGVSLLAGGIGVAVIAVGVTLAALLKDNPYEELAKYSFLGDNWDAKPKFPSWSPLPLPGAPDDEAVALLSIVSGFEIELKDKEILMIHPKFHRPGDVIELYFEANYGATSPNAALIEIDLESGEVIQTHGIRPLRPSVSPTFDANGVMTSIRIDLLEVDDGRTLWFKTDLKVQARMRLKHPRQTAFYVPAVPALAPENPQPGEPWTEVRWTAWGGSGKASSADPSEQINRLEHPMSTAMRMLAG